MQDIQNNFEYYKTALKKWNDFDGKSNRPEFWYFVLFNFIISALLDAVTHSMHMGFISTVYSLVLLLPSIAVGVRRMHDIGRSGWWIIVPLYNIYLAAQPSKGAHTHAQHVQHAEAK